MIKFELVSGTNKHIDEVILKFRESIEPLTFEESLMLINEVEFDLMYDEDSERYFLNDKQGANLGDIENEDFRNIIECLERLTVYFVDYGILYDDDFGWLEDEK
jgi:hypothetical protein